MMREHEQTTRIPSTAVTTTPSTPKLTNTPPPSPALSTGAGAGIGVGAAVAACIGLVVLWFGWRRAKKRHALSAHAVALEEIGDTEPRKINDVQSTTIQASYYVTPERQGDGLFEVLGDNPQRELDGHHVPHRQELEGSGG